MRQTAYFSIAEGMEDSSPKMRLVQHKLYTKACGREGESASARDTETGLI